MNCRINTLHWVTETYSRTSVFRKAYRIVFVFMASTTARIRIHGLPPDKIPV